MAPKWTTPEQELFLESRYSRYGELQNQGKRTIFKQFWASLKRDWTGTFGWTAEDDVDAKGSPCLEKVSICILSLAF